MSNEPPLLDFGGYPWQPTPDSTRETELRYWNRPIQGVFQQGDSRFLFECESNFDTGPDLWSFVLLEPAELAADQVWMSLHELDAELARIRSSGRTVWFALTDDASEFITDALGPWRQP